MQTLLITDFVNHLCYESVISLITDFMNRNVMIRRFYESLILWKYLFNCPGTHIFVNQSFCDFIQEPSCLSLFQSIYLFPFTYLFSTLSVIGSTWTLNVYDEVNYDSKSSATYCPKYLYRFTFYTIIAVRINVGTSFW